MAPANFGNPSRPRNKSATRSTTCGRTRDENVRKLMIDQAKAGYRGQVEALALGAASPPAARLPAALGRDSDVIDRHDRIFAGHDPERLARA